MVAAQGVIVVSDASAVGEARRRIRQIAEEASLNAEQREKAAIVATELATNLARYASDGEIHLCAGSSASNRWVDIISIDRGPGMQDAARCLEDGHSTGGGCGTGLGAVRRLSSDFDIYSQMPAGTVIFSRVADHPASAGSRPTFSWGIVSRPAPHEAVCGDSYRIAERTDALAIMIADGLGHGPEAARAAEEAAHAFDDDPFTSLTMLMDRADARMRGTRGGAMAAAHIEARGRIMKYTGVGNISGYLHSLNGEDGRGLFSHNGTVGHQMRRVTEFDYPCPDQSLLIMHSDGLTSRWSLESYTGLAFRHPAVIAGILYRDFTRGRDDVTVAAVRLSLTQVP